MKPRILLIQPPIEDFYTTPLRLFPLGLLQIATPLKQAGYEVKILDCISGVKPKVIPVPQKFNYIKKYYDEKNKSPFRLFGNYYHFGLSNDEIAEYVKSYKPDIVGISSLFSAYYENALKCAEIVKDVNTNIITVLGGVYASVMPETLMKNGIVDYVIRGEGEFMLKSLVASLEKNKPVKSGRLNKYNVIGDLDALPFNDLSLIPSQNYASFAMIQTSRGCPLKCDFCSIPVNPGSKFRAKSPERVVEEILYYRKNFGVKHVDIEDDNFTADKGRSIKILDLLKEAKFKLSAMNGLSSQFLEEGILYKMKESGFSKINLSLVSSDFISKKQINRRESVNHLGHIIRYADSLSMEVETHFIIGIPGEDPVKTMDSLVYLTQLPAKIGGSIFYSVPGTNLFNKCVGRKWIINEKDPSFWRLTLASVESYEGARRDQITFLYLVRLINFMKKLKKKYIICKNTILFNEVIKELEEYINSFTVQEHLGFLLLKNFMETGKINKIYKNKTKYTIREESHLNNELLKLFLSKAKYLEC